MKKRTINHTVRTVTAFREIKDLGGTLAAVFGSCCTLPRLRGCLQLELTSIDSRGSRGGGKKEGGPSRRNKEKGMGPEEWE